MYDLIIIGSGPAGLSAAIAADKLSLKSALFGIPENSMAWQIPIVANYPGFPNPISGEELIKKILEQVKKSDIDLFTEKIVEISNNETNFFLKSEKGKEISAKALILAIGSNSEESEKFQELKEKTGIFLAGDYRENGNFTIAVGEGAKAASEANVFIRTIPSLNLP